MQAKIKEYGIFSEHTAWALSDAVCLLLKDGWKLYGEPFVNEQAELYCQAMVKYEE